MRVLLFTGKGGVGKTTTACATALRLAERGCKTLLLSADGAHSVADALAVPVGGEPGEVAESLWAVQVDTQRRFEAAWRDIQDYLLRLLSRSGVDPVTAAELTVLPGIDEVLALLAVRDLATSGQWDAVVVDCAPTAETLRLLALPEALGWYLAKVFPAHRRLARTVRPFASLLGRGEAVPPDGAFAALLRLADELDSVRQLLADRSTTSVRLVLTPEAIVTAEARRTFTALSLYGYQVDMVVANRVFPAELGPADSGGSDDWRRGWVRAQQRQLLEVGESFDGIEVRQVSYGAVEPVGALALGAVADQLYGPLPGADPAQRVPAPEPMRVEREGEEFVLRLHLPLATRGEVAAARAGDDLVVTVGPYRRVITLPGVLRRCQVNSGHFAEHELQVRFRPDPSLWPAELWPAAAEGG
jgi:arsenite-transporting ATPase